MATQAGNGSGELRAGVIGVGYLGRFHAQKYAALEGVRLVGVADTDIGRARQVAEETGCVAHADHGDLLERVDMVSVVAPTRLHHRIGMDCLAAGLDLLMEKPITVSLEEADELIALAADQGRILQVGHLERFNPALMALRQRVDRPLYMEAVRTAPFKSRGVDVDVVLDLMIHDLDIVLSLAGAPLRRVSALGAAVVTRHIDLARARLEFANGAVADLTAGRVMPETVRRLRILQKNAFLEVDFSVGTLREITRDQARAEDGFPAPDLGLRRFPSWDNLESELRAFVHCVRTRTRPEVDGAQGRLALETALEVVAAMQGHAKDPDPGQPD